ncbi:MAG: hypothetical protein R2761_18885 [Acidimicrobiales bacterium]
MADQNDPRPNVRSEPLPADDAHELVLDLERRGVSSDHIDVETEPPRSVSEVSAVDNATIRRQARRVVIGSVAGAAVGLAVALIALLIWDSLWWPPTVITTALVGSILGALWSLYGGLEASPDVTDADAGGPTVIETRVVDLDREKAAEIRRRTDQAAD